MTNDLERARALCDELSETWAMTCEEVNHLQELVVQFATTIRAEERARCGS